MSTTSNNIYRLTGSLQHYDWGGTGFIPALLGISNDQGKPCAEYWLGAHSKSPSLIALEDGRQIRLDEFISSAPEKYLGRKVFKRFGGLPYLLKVQDVAAMLSIQVHPSKESAEKKFLEEDQKGIPVTAPERNYKDRNHKPELLSPVSDFYLLHGFRTIDAMKAILHGVPELEFLEQDFESGDYQRLYTTVMKMPQEEVNSRLKPLLNRIVPLYDSGQLTQQSPDFWAARASKTFNNNGNTDRGIFSIYLFNIVSMKKGEALFQDAGLPHAYLEGHTMEIMANSDNVLRGGLTPKHIDVDELLEHTRFTATVPNILAFKHQAGERKFETPADDFLLSRISIPEGENFEVTTSTLDIYFVFEGNVEFSSGDQKINVMAGQALVAIAGTALKVSAAENAVIYRATADLKD